MTSEFTIKPEIGSRNKCDGESHCGRCSAQFTFLGKPFARVSSSPVAFSGLGLFPLDGAVESLFSFLLALDSASRGAEVFGSASAPSRRGAVDEKRAQTAAAEAIEVRLQRNMPDLVKYVIGGKGTDARLRCSRDIHTHTSRNRCSHSHAAAMWRQRVWFCLMTTAIAHDSGEGAARKRKYCVRRDTKQL